jgi:nucleoside-diphosphate-sugar epimerase
MIHEKVSNLRQSASFIIETRQRRESRIFLTGGTGFLGSHIAVELMRRGYFVILLCRPNDKQSAEDRIRSILQWHNVTPAERMEVIEGRITERRLGLSEEAYRHLLGRVDEIFHCTGHTSFAERDRGHLKETNVQGTLNILDLAMGSGCYFFHHMSTAYVSGRKQGVCREEWEECDSFCNPYEQTKYEAEGHVLEKCKDAGIRVNIYRPSIVYGHSKTGRSMIFNAFYFPIRIGHYLKQLYEKDIKENEGRNTAHMGISRTEDGKIHFPLRLIKTERSSFNLVPIDFVVDGCMAIMEDSLEGDIFHLVGHSPCTIDTVIHYTETMLGITGIWAQHVSDFDEEPKNALEKMVASYIDLYRPYFTDERIFDDEKAGKILRRHNITCPELDYELFQKCISYGIHVEWGKRLFNDGQMKNRLS